MKNRVIYYDVLRTISIIAVILIHIIGNTINTFRLEGIPAQVYTSIWQLMYFAVPMFIMISGGLFLNPEKEISIKDLYKKYILRIVIALFIFGILYSILELYFSNKITGFKLIIQAIKNVFTGDLWAHMWYLYLILGLYIISPLLKIFVKNCTAQQLQYVLFVLFIFTIVIPDIVIMFNQKIAFNAVITNPYIFLYLLGYYVSKYDISKKWRISNYILSAVFIVLIILNNFINLFNAELITYTSFITFNIILSLFYIVKRCKKSYNQVAQKILKNISDCGFGIYLIHQAIINVIYKVLKFDIITKYPYIFLIIYTLFVFGTSYLIVYYLRKIKIIRKYLL